MSIRTLFDDELSLLNTELIKMGALCERAVMSALNVYFLGKKPMPKRQISLKKKLIPKKEILRICA